MSFRVLVAVDPPLLEELLVALLDEPGMSVHRARDVVAGSPEPFDAVIENGVGSPCLSAASVIRLTSATGGGRAALVSTSSGDALVPVDTLADLRALLQTMRSP